jgi:transcriptional regulator with XRE-family HTH domain
MGTPHSADVVSIGRHTAYRADFGSLAAQQMRAAREKSGCDRAAFAAVLTGLLGWGVSEPALARWERGTTPPGDVLLAAASASEGGLIAPPGTLLGPVPHSFPASALEGPWVTAYQFTHNGTPCHHADIAIVAAETERQIRAANHPPEPRTEGRAQPFRNEIEARLAGRHLIGHWKNTSDARYFGSLHLAVLPGETVMEGYYTGLASDIGVSVGPWRWCRLEYAARAEGALAGLTLHEPAAVYEAVMNHSQYGAGLALHEIGEEA